MFKAIRVSILLFILLFVALSSWLTQARSTDWDNSLWVKVYPINADGSDASEKYIATLETSDFADIEEFIAREVARYGRTLSRPLRMELGQPIEEQPPEVGPDPGVLGVVAWSLKMRWWASSTAGEQDRVDPDVRIFLRYHNPDSGFVLENSVGLQKGMVGVVNARAGRREQQQRDYRPRISAHPWRDGQIRPGKRSAAGARRPGRTGSRPFVSATLGRNHGRPNSAGP